MIAFKVGRAAGESGAAAGMSDEVLRSEIKRHFWTPEYRTYTLRK
jgi:hypothetical protein